MTGRGRADFAAEGSPVFPPRYRGAFESDQHAVIPAPGRQALSQAARDMLRRELGPDRADQMIWAVERMAAAAAMDRPL